MMKSKRGQGGFSIIELVAVTAIMLVVAAFAAPTVTRAVRSYRVGSAARDLSNIIQRARYEAIKRNIATGCRAQFVNGQWQVWVDFNANQQVDSNPPLNEPFILLPSDVQFLAPGQVPAVGSMGYNQTRTIANVIVFDPRGTVDFGGAAPAVMLSFIGIPTDTSTGYRALAITPNGKIKIWQASAGQSGYWK